MKPNTEQTHNWLISWKKLSSCVLEIRETAITVCAASLFWRERAAQKMNKIISKLWQSTKDWSFINVKGQSCRSSRITTLVENYRPHISSHYNSRDIVYDSRASIRLATVIEFLKWSSSFGRSDQEETRAALHLYYFNGRWSLPWSSAVWPEKNRQMSIKVTQKWFHYKNDRF